MPFAGPDLGASGSPAPGVFDESGSGGTDVPMARLASTGGGLLGGDGDDDGAHGRYRWPAVLEDEEQEDEEGPGWVAPSIGGDESLLPVRRPAGKGRRRVVSVYDGQGAERERGDASANRRRGG
jgi:hypothetical protein